MRYLYAVQAAAFRNEPSQSVRSYFRGDAAFANPSVHEHLEA